jgi:uncharacterized protein with von Willebrand factor type A (vWA) domain
VIKADGWDKRTYATIRDHAKSLKEAEEAARKIIPTGPLLFQDLWAGLFKASPELEETVPPSLKLNRKLIEQTVNSPAFQETREGTRLDEWGAALGALSFGKKLVEILPEEVRKQAEEAARRQAEAEKMQQLAQQLMQAAQKAENQADNQNDPEKAAQARQEAAQKMAEAQQQIRQAQEAMAAAAAHGDNAANGLEGKAVQAAVKAAAGETEETVEMVAALCWGTGPGGSSQIDGKRVFEVAEALNRNDNLKKMARLAGRMIRIAMNKQRSKILREPAEVVDIRLGDDISSVLPTELALLCHPVLRHEFFLRYTKGELLQYETREREKLGSGPIIQCVDTSGSMGGEKHIWAKAIALTLAKIAARQRRAFALIIFGSSTEIKVYKWPDPSKVDPAEIADAAMSNFGGGTDFERPLTEAMKLIEESAFKRADIIFATDGICYVGDAFLANFKKLKQAKEFSCYSIVLPPGTTECVNEFSDQSILATIDNDSEALDLVFSV